MEQSKQEKHLLSDLLSVENGNLTLARRLINQYFPKKIKETRNEVLDAVEKFGIKKVDEAITLYGSRYYERLIECEENHLIDECELCRV